MITLGKNIKARRDEFDITQSELANRVNVNRAMISYIESGEKVPSLAVFARIAETLHLSMDELYHNKSG